MKNPGNHPIYDFSMFFANMVDFKEKIMKIIRRLNSGIFHKNPRIHSTILMISLPKMTIWDVKSRIEKFSGKFSEKFSEKFSDSLNIIEKLPGGI